MSNYSPEYVAGVLDSDGSVFIQRQVRGVMKDRVRYHLKIEIAQYRDDDLMEWLQTEFGGLVTRYQSRRNIPSWLVFGRKAEKFLRWIEPHSRIKRDNIQLALSLIEIPSHPGVLRTPEVVAQQENVYQRMYELNHRYAALRA